MPDPETLTAALRRLADEGASGVVAVTGSDPAVLLTVEDGRLVAIGPTPDVTDRVGGEARPEVTTAAVVDLLAERTVEAMVVGSGDWEWVAASSAPTTLVPPGMATEMGRRAVDAAQALTRIGADAVLAPGRPMEVSGEVGALAAQFDGTRTVRAVAAANGTPLTAVAVQADALVRAGRLVLVGEEGEPVDWGSPGYGDTDVDDSDEPEPWVMGAEEEPAAPPARPTPAAEVMRRRAEGPPPSSTGPPAGPPDAEPAATEAPAAEAPAAEPAAAEPVEAAEAAEAARDGEGWDDVAWLEDLEDAPSAGDATLEPRLGHRDPDAHAALTEMLRDLQGDDPRGGGRPAGAADEPDDAGPEPAATGASFSAPDDDRDEAVEDDGDDGIDTALRRDPRADPGEVAEFLRELSRLALDDED